MWTSLSAAASHKADILTGRGHYIDDMQLRVGYQLLRGLIVQREGGSSAVPARR